MDALEKIYEEQKQQRDIEEKEASYARNIAIKVINMFLCVAQVKQKDKYELKHRTGNNRNWNWFP